MSDLWARATAAVGDQIYGEITNWQEKVNAGSAVGVTCSGSTPMTLRQPN